MSRRIFRALLGCAFLFALPPLRAEWTATVAEKISSPNDNLSYQKISCAEAATGAEATVELAIFDPKKISLRVIDQGDEPRESLGEIMRNRGALAGVNGGYFDPENRPVGLLVSDGQTIAPLRKAKLLTGVLFAEDGRVEIARATHFKISAKIKSAVQCGPLLVERGQPVAGLNDTRAARRTFAAVDRVGHVALGVCSPVTLAQLSRILGLANLGTVKIVRALNLDGGSSTAFWFAGRDGIISHPEIKTVRDFVGLFPRGDR